MVYRPKFCKRCGRPIKKTYNGYCEDCYGFVKVGVDSEKNSCSHCGVSKYKAKLWRNIKTRKLYCQNCLKVFEKGLEANNIPKSDINRILRTDFERVEL